MAVASVDVESRDLRNPGARAVEQFQQGGVPQPDGILSVGGGQQPLDLGDAERLGESFAQFGNLDLGGWVLGGHFLLVGEGVEVPHADEGPCHRGPLEFRGQFTDVFADLHGAHIPEVGHAPAREEGEVAFQVTAIGGHGVGPQSPFHAHVCQVLLQRVLGGVHSVTGPDRPRRIGGAQLADAPGQPGGF